MSTETTVTAVGFMCTMRGAERRASVSLLGKAREANECIRVAISVERKFVCAELVPENSKGHYVSGLGRNHRKPKATPL